MMPMKKRKIMLLSLAMLVLFLVIVQTAPAYGQGSADQWSLSLSLLNEQGAPSTNFAPFDQINLTSRVTYGNASVPDQLVTFKIQGPAGSENSISVTLIEKTNGLGVAECSFRLPAKAQNSGSVIGKWQATASIQTSNSTLKKSQSFTTNWNLQITSVSIENQQGQNQTIFYPGNTAKVGLAINDADSAQQANITLNMQDASGKIVNQTQIENTQINSNFTSPTELQVTLQIPTNTIAGEASVTAAIYAGTYQNTGVPAGENQTAYFTIVGSGGLVVSPSPEPSKTPTILQNSVSLFSWLLVATGLFTFTMLYFFLRRKPILETGPQMSNLPRTKPGPTISAAFVDPPQPKPNNQQPTPTKMELEKIIQATTTTEVPAAYETWSNQASSTLDAPMKPESKPFAPQELTQSIATYLSKISETGKKVQTLESALKVEREQLTKEITDLNKTLEEQERAVKSYFDSIRQAVEGAIRTQTSEARDLHETQTNGSYNTESQSQPKINEKSNASNVDDTDKTDQPQTETNPKLSQQEEQNSTPKKR
ncbi:MAG: hypothetical protein ABSF65_04850 [Candidatus Bathyarchaeia archaeon]